MNRNPDRPNLLFIFTDEQRFDTLAAYGNSRIDMPNLNRLAERSTVFERTYDTQPVCTPARSSIMTGLTPHTNGCVRNNIPLDLNVPTIAEMVPTDGTDGYFTAYHGKWHLGDEIFAQHGFREWISIEDMYRSHYREGRDRTLRSDYHHWLVERGIEPEDGSTFTRYETAKLAEEFSKPAFLAENATRFFRERSGDGKPFLLYVNFLEPHTPFFGPRNNQYPPEDVLIPPNFGNPPNAKQPLRQRINARQLLEEGHSDLPLVTEADWRKIIARYWGLCSQVDTHVGRILDALAETGLDESTIVVFTSDHGEMMGSHRLMPKTMMFEESSRIPMLVHLPGQTEQHRVTTPVSQIDLVPTLLDLLNQPKPDHLEGESLADVIRLRKDGTEHRDVFIEWNGRNLGARVPEVKEADLRPYERELGTPQEIARTRAAHQRTVVTPDGWKFSWDEFGEHELYHLSEDPYETQNLAHDTAARGTMRELAERIKNWQKRTGDTVTLATF
ncbi:MAG TPA: hypothetical protein ENN56_05230 [Firmicutes bacterium]|nr:hypothetical protein [Bacillota bacterium]